jgi:hypothetical protein
MVGQITIEDWFHKEEERYVRQVTYEDVLPFLLGIHYARRIPVIQYAYGLYVGGVLVGVVTYGVPASPSITRGLAGEKNKDKVLELNRLCFLPEYNGGNNASYLVGHSLKMLPGQWFIVSYADTAWSHAGYVYQATNFIYTGKTKERTDIASKNGGHSRHYEKGTTERVFRSSKHRYVYLVGNRRERKEMRRELRYSQMPYPKGDERRYDVNNPRSVMEEEE